MLYFYIWKLPFAAADGHRYIFSSNSVWRWPTNSNTLSEQHTISDIFPNAPNRVTAAVSNSWNQLTLLFNGRTVYAYEYSNVNQKFEMESGFPKELPKLITITPQYAFTWRDGNQVLVDVSAHIQIQQTSIRVQHSSHTMRTSMSLHTLAMCKIISPAYLQIQQRLCNLTWNIDRSCCYLTMMAGECGVTLKLCYVLDMRAI